MSVAIDIKELEGKGEHGIRQTQQALKCLELLKRDESVDGTTNSSGVNGKLVNRISFRLGRNDEIRTEYLSTSYWKRHYIRLSTG